MTNKLNSIFDYHDLIEAIVAAEEMRDYHTAHHSTRVSNMSEEICKLMGLSNDETQLIHIAADLHDIGKIGISDAVLLKKGKLNENEWVEMKSHTLIGHYILNKVDSFSEIADIVRYHHERWDGNGYPDHISGADIPLGSRIIAIADSIDAMLSNRSYRKGMSSDQCRQQIETNIGIMYDEKIAKLVLANWDTVLSKRQLSKYDVSN